ncbi:MAG: ferritin [Verrucomicrobia bacterium]|nr:MAG: ferritin [Verrucomicrobiota bacterium]
MTISEKLNEAMNAQIGAEFAASIQYVAVSAYFAAEGLVRLAARFDQQANEERDHALKLIKYLLDTGGKVRIPAIPAPKCEFGSVAEAVEMALEQEKQVTRQINELMAIAVEDRDFAAQNLLQWFVAEQVEEVANMDNLLKVVRRAGEENLIYVESYLGDQASQVASGPGE